jgi:hypothetical protein
MSNIRAFAEKKYKQLIRDCGVIDKIEAEIDQKSSNGQN